ncbi:MAG: Flp family type IVb pilin [Shewanella sp.]
MLNVFKNFVAKFKKDERGVTAVEYAIIAVAMSALVLAVYTNGDVKDALESAMATVKSNIQAASGSAGG